jgi:hypothetical protein
LPFFKTGGEWERELDRGEIGALSGRVVDVVTKGGELDRSNERKDKRGDIVMRGITEVSTTKGRW